MTNDVRQTIATEIHRHAVLNPYDLGMGLITAGLGNRPYRVDSADLISFLKGVNLSGEFTDAELADRVAERFGL